MPSHISLDISLAQAQAMAQAALEHAAAQSLRISLSIVNASGHEVLSLRSDGASWFTVEVARSKARTAAAMRRETEKLGALKENYPELLALIDGQLPFTPTTMAGGIPLWEHGTADAGGGLRGSLRGGIGVSGASPEQDAACARAAARADGAYPGCE
jgi:glc operon protein GlcG